MRTNDKSYTDEEKILVDRYIESFTVKELKTFLSAKNLSVDGKREDLLSRIREERSAGTISFSELVAELDRTQPWGAQHVILFGEPAGLPNADSFEGLTEFRELLKSVKLLKALGKRIALILPEALTVSAIEYSDVALRITAVERRHGFVRDEDMDEWGTDEHGQRVHKRAYIEEINRGLIIFEWDRIKNVAMLQITRLPTNDDYDKALDRFRRVVRKWLDLSRFPLLDPRSAVKALHQEEKDLGVKAARARACGIKYDTKAGGSIETTSATSKLSILSDSATSQAASIGLQSGVGRNGNFYWRDHPTASGGERGLHVKILGKAGRIHFPTDEKEEDIRHVLKNIRELCK